MHQRGSLKGNKIFWTKWKQNITSKFGDETKATQKKTDDEETLLAHFMSPVLPQYQIYTKTVWKKKITDQYPS